MMEAEIEIRPPATKTELLQAAELVRSSLEPDWRFGGRAIEKVMAEALIAFDHDEVVGAAALHHGHRAAVNVVAVRAALRRRGIGTRLVESASASLRRRGATDISAAGSGPYLWPGIPRNIHGAVEFFTANDWTITHDVHDLTRSLTDFVTPTEILARARGAGVEFGLATITERDWLATNASEHWYPGWDEYFAVSAPENIVVGRTQDGSVAAALIIGLPGQTNGWQPMLGPGVTTIGCVGTLHHWREHGIGTALVAAASEMLRDAGGSVCHIGWTVLLSFYGRLGYKPWRTYAMATRGLDRAP